MRFRKKGLAHRGRSCAIIELEGRTSMQPSEDTDRAKQNRFNTARDRHITIGISLFLCVIFAGVIGFDYAREKPDFKDPRPERVSTHAENPMNPNYEGYIPDDAVIPTKEGIFIPDGKGNFRKVSKFR
jgi:hypothetical protein